MSSRSGRNARRMLRTAIQVANRKAPDGVVRNGYGTNGKSHEQILSEELLLNAMSMRKEWLTSQMDDQRNIEDECGYPENITVQNCKQLYDRDSIAARVVQVFPRECWALQPTIYEDDDSEVVTTFEQAWDTLGKNLLGEESKFKQESGNPIYEYFKRLDTLSGIGSFGVMLLGLDDGLPLYMPVNGFEDSAATDPEDPKQKSDTDKMKAEGSQADIMPGSGRMGSEEQYYDNFGRTVLDGPMPSIKKKSVKNALGDDENVDEKRAVAEEEETIIPEDDDDAEEGEEETDEGTKQFGQEYSETVVGEEEDMAPEFIPGVKLLYVRCFDESLVQVVQYESDQTSPRFGQPLRYLITLNDARTQHSGVGLSLASVYVHWSRVIHLADVHWQENSSEIFAPPRLECVFNRVWDLYKMYGGSAEGYWKGSIPALSIETHPSLGGDVVVDKSGLKDMMEQRNNGLQRDIYLMGMAAKTLPPQALDPTTYIDVHITAICIKIGTPKRIFMGSERGELASGQDDSTWNDRVQERQTNYLTPRLLVPFIDRMIKIGCLPEPAGYSIEWPDLNTASETEKATVSKLRLEALTAYIQGGIESMITPLDALTQIMGYDEATAKAMLEAAAEAIELEERITQDQMAMEQEQADHDMDIDQQMIDEGMNPAGETTQIGDTVHQELPKGAQDALAGGKKVPPPMPGKGGGFPPKKGGGKPPWVRNERIDNGGPGSGPQKGSAGTHDVKLPKDKKRVTIDQVDEALKQMGYKDAKRLQPEGPNWKSLTEITSPSGERTTLDSKQIKAIVYSGHSDSGQDTVFPRSTENVFCDTGSGGGIDADVSDA